jgi:hypothetical protein
MKRILTYLKILPLLLGLLSSGLSFAQPKTITKNNLASLNPVFKLDQLDPNAIITLDVADHAETEKNGIKFINYIVRFINPQNQKGTDFKYSADQQCYIPVLDKNLNGLKQDQAAIKIGFYQNAPFKSLRIPISQLDKTSTLTAILSAHFSKQFDQNQLLLLALNKTHQLTLHETKNAVITNNAANEFIISEFANLSTLSSAFLNSENRAFALKASEEYPPIKIMDDENKLLHGLIFLDLPYQQLQKLTYSTYGMCWKNHQSLTVDVTDHIIPVYLSCEPHSENQVHLNITQPFPVYLSAKSTPQKTPPANSLSFDLFNDKFIQLKGATILPYTFIYLDLSDQFLKSQALKAANNIIESVQDEGSHFSLFASNHLKPLIINSSDLTKETKNNYFMRLHSLAPNPPGIHQETQLIIENCLKADNQLLDPIDLIFVFTGNNASFNLNLINAIIMGLPQNTSIHCTLYIPAKHIGLYKTEDLLRHRFLDKIIIEFQYFK